MTFYKIKHISVKNDGTILCNIGKLGDVFRHKDGSYYLAKSGDSMIPLYDSHTGDLVGFCDTNNITFEEFED